MDYSTNRVLIKNFGQNVLFEYLDQNLNPTGYYQGAFAKGSSFFWTENIILNEVDEIVDYVVIIQHEGSNIFMGNLSDIKLQGLETNIENLILML